MKKRIVWSESETEVLSTIDKDAIGLTYPQREAARSNLRDSPEDLMKLACDLVRLLVDVQDCCGCPTWSSEEGQALFLWAKQVLLDEAPTL